MPPGARGPSGGPGTASRGPVGPSDPFGGPDDEFAADLPQAEARGPVSAQVPEDIYHGRLIGLEKKTSKANNPMWVWHFMIVSGDFSGSVLLLYTALTPEAMWKLTETCEALGLGQGGQQMRFKKDDAIGRECCLVVVNDFFNGQERTSLNKAAPLDDYQALKAEFDQTHQEATT